MTSCSEEAASFERCAEAAVAGSRGHPIFAAFYQRFAGLAERAGMAERRRDLLAGVSGRVLEIGAGTGLNFAHYPAAVTEVIATEPDPNMLKRAASAARAAPVPVTLQRAAAGALPLEDASVDAVVSTLVLCSVPDQARALAEVRRVLKPGGRLLFLEHVRADSPGLARWQDRVERPWGFFAAGCHPNRDTVTAIRDAGFELEDVEKYDFPGIPPVRPHMSGTARLPAG